MRFNKKFNNKIQAEALRKAQEAANKGDARGMLQGLLDSMLIEGYEKHLKWKYQDIDPDDIHDLIVDGVYEMCFRVSKGEKIFTVGSYLWQVLFYKIKNFIAQRKLFSNTDVEQIGVKTQFVEQEKLKEESDRKREEIFSIAEGLISRLGLVNVQNVMRYILVAAKNGARDVPNNEISDALGLSYDNVKQSRKRGFDRLILIFKNEKLIPDDYHLFYEETEYLIDENDAEKYE